MLCGSFIASDLTIVPGHPAAPNDDGDDTRDYFSEVVDGEREQCDGDGSNKGINGHSNHVGSARKVGSTKSHVGSSSEQVDHKPQTTKETPEEQ